MESPVVLDKPPEYLGNEVGYPSVVPLLFIKSLGVLNEFESNLLKDLYLQ